MLNGLFVSKLKIVRPIYKTKLFFILFSLNKITFFLLLKKKKKKHIHISITQLCFFFFHILKFIIWNIVPIHFLYYEYFKYIFLRHFLNYSFRIILNNNALAPLTSMPKVTTLLGSTPRTSDSFTFCEQQASLCMNYPDWNLNPQWM